MALFNIQLEEIKNAGVDTDQLVNFLKLIDAPRECTDIGRVICTLYDSARVTLSLAPSSPQLKELVSLLQTFWEHSNRLPRHPANEDDNPMFNRYADYPVYSLFTQHGNSPNDFDVSSRFRKVNGLLLASAWIANAPISNDYTEFVDELRKIRRDNSPNEILSIIENAGSVQQIINSFSSKSQNILKSSFRKLALKIQETLPRDNSTSISLDDIESHLLGDKESGEAEVETFREILSVIRFNAPPLGQLDSILEALEKLLPIVEMLDSRFTDVWPRWASAIRKARNILQELISSPVTTQTGISNPTTPQLVICLTAQADKNAYSGLVPAKAILLIGHYIKYLEYKHTKIEWRYHKSSEQYLADAIQRCYSAKKTVFLPVAKEYLPEWPSSSPAQWKKSFIEISKSTPKVQGTTYKGISTPDKHQFIHTIRRILLSTSPAEDISAQPKEVISPPAIDQPRSPELRPQKREKTTLVTKPLGELDSRAKRKRSIRAPFNLFQAELPHTEAIADGIAPTALLVVPQQDTAADQPIQLAAAQSLEVRYTNYRTSMDNQRLPWAWDCLNKFEIVELRKALKAHANLENASITEKLGAFLTWLLLATGQSVSQILSFDLGHTQGNSLGALLVGSIYRRRINSPPHAFHPNEQQKILLSSHADFVDLPLLPPFPALLNELGLNSSNAELINRSQNIGAYLGLDELAAEKVVRQFLEPLRTRDIRLLPGRIRNVLGAEIMRASGDPVVTHLLSALPTDMPPSGIYYTSCSIEVLQRIYKQAVTKIFGDGG